MSKKTNNKSDKKVINEELEKLDELIRKVDKMLLPDEMRYDANWFMNMDIRRKMLETHPKCFVSLTVPYNNPVYLPICNRTAVEDPLFVRLSKRVAKNLKKRGKVDPKIVDNVLAKLDKIDNRLKHDIPKPYTSSQRKKNMTQFLNRIRTQLKSRENGNE